MKRSPLLRKTPMKRGSPMPRHKAALRAGKTRLKKSALRETVYRNEAYLAAVRTLPCVNCGRPGCTQAAHSNQLRFGKGGRLKASDATAMALCSFPSIGVSGCHEILDSSGKMAKADRNEFEYEMIALTVMNLVAREILTDAPGVIAKMPKPGISFEATALYLVHAIENNLLQVAK
jgi:hypothetical protein